MKSNVFFLSIQISYYLITLLQYKETIVLQYNARVIR